MQDAVLNSTPLFYVRDVPVYGDTILAPMDGYSDWPFRSICRALGSAMSYTEFVKVEKILSRSKEPAKRLYYEEAERPITFQIYGDDPELLLKAALKIEPLQPDIIDINMGCPAKSIADRGAGVGMMPTPLKIARTFRKLVKNLRVPVTGKIRLGWDRNKNYKLIARIVEEEGGSLIAVHGRTKEQRYTGSSDWDAIAANLAHAVVRPVMRQVRDAIVHVVTRHCALPRACVRNAPPRERECARARARARRPARSKQARGTASAA